MMMRDCMLYAGIRTSRRFAELGWFQRDFFYGLLHAAWPAGRFEADVEVLRAALHAPLLKKVSKRDVQDALVRCHQLGLVKLWTDESGRGWGEVVNYRQHGLKKRKPSGDEEPPPDPRPPDDGPELFPRTRGHFLREGGKKEGRESTRREAPPAPTPMIESQDDWQARLARDWPAVNIAAELEKARRRKGGHVERAWFERSWLPNVSPAVQFASGSTTTARIEPEPEAWRLWLETEHPESAYAKGGRDEGMEWHELPPPVRKFIVAGMASVSH